MQKLVKGILLSISLLVMLLTAYSGKAQLENSNWAFGNNAGLNFSFVGAGSVTATKGFVSTNEGSSIISDQNGQILFVTDGTVIRDRNGNPMPNGNGILGSLSATQAALIIPYPNSGCRKYIVFTTPKTDELPAAPATTRILRYSIVDMGLNGGFGDVIANQKNIPLLTRSSEKLAGVASNIPGEFWVIAHGFDERASINDKINQTYYVSKITTNGVSPMVPYIVGSPHTNCASSTTSQAAGSGQMKINQARTQIASAVMLGFVEVVNFNASTGGVSNTAPALKFSACNAAFFSATDLYGVEFSPNGQHLFATVGTTLVQIPSFAASPSSSTTISSGNGTTEHFASLQIGPDLKIYAARNGRLTLGRINNPNGVGIPSGYVDNAIPLAATTKSFYGLPTQVVGIQGRFPPCCSSKPGAIDPVDPK